MEIRETQPFTLLPCRPDVCQECAVDHKTEEAHNQQSLYYQYHFYFANGRWPTWWDAIAHCAPEVQEFWIVSLMQKGIALYEIHRCWGNPEQFSKGRRG
jgi:hypothetical protein